MQKIVFPKINHFNASLIHRLQDISDPLKNEKNRIV